MRGAALRLIIVVLVLMTGLLAGCSQEEAGDELPGSGVDYTVVEDADVPEKLKELIEQRKNSEFRLTYATNEYMYMAVGYGTQETDGFSIQVRGVTLDDETVYVGTSLFGPRSDEKVSKTQTTPYIVIKVEKIGSTVIYR